MICQRHIGSKQSGFSLIEVLVTLVVLLLGLLGLAGLQSRAQLAETESYQREQALVLARDMADRLSASRNNAASFVTGTSNPLGRNSTKDCSAPATVIDDELCKWDDLLKGAAETSGINKIGAMIDARGCITNPAANQYLIEVVWQGLAPTSAPPASLLCGKNQYTSEDQRRAVTTVVQIGVLSP